ncbi:MAG: UDP-2,3-diacylglucosamine pyrophosphatase [Alphaproteobacteria bacterium CG11_big_fil_rev_8_21_14_0_20_39_49]|nr:MAG: UDP-2,3-diacylglucosamine pyrophosphatase [Alphaproteobacteria bacterium CG11_big_fil_rev_8_21_14_0_20_39_49]
MQHDTKFSKIGLIAGNGDLPEKIISQCINSGIDVFVILITDNLPSSISKVQSVKLNIGSVGKAIKTLKEEKVEQVVFAGGLKRPKLLSLSLDAGGIKLLARITKAKFNGDNKLLTTVIGFFEDNGFEIVGADEILEDALVTMGQLGMVKPDQRQKEDIEVGKEIAKKIGELDIGQSVIVQDGVVIGVEAIEGTDGLIQRCSELQMEKKGGVLVKVKKPGQDSRVDLPTIGPVTIMKAYENGLSGIAVEAGGALIIDKEEVIKMADEYGLFLIGV